MNLVSRYIDEVKRHLPSTNREDAGRELSTLLSEELNSLRTQRGHELADEEVARFLRDFGHPYKIASAYHRRRSLVGEAAYPLYKRTLVTTLSIYLVVDVLLTLFRINEHQDIWGARLIPEFLHSLADTLLFGFLLITLVFHYVGEPLARLPFFWRWNPSRLPELHERWAAIPLTGAAIEAVSQVVVLALLTVARYDYVGEDFTVSLDPLAVAAVQPLRLLVLLGLAVQIVNLFQRYWTRTKLILSALLRTASAALLVRVAIIPHVIHISVKAADAQATHWSGWWPDVNVRVLCIVIAAVLVYRAVRSFGRAVTAQLDAW